MNGTVPDPLAPLATFKVGPWRCSIRQLVSGPLFWEAIHERTGARAGRVPAGMDVAAAQAECERILTTEPPPLP
jgi:hypothetical protein